MDFFTRQDQARRQTTILLFYFIAAVILVVGTLNVVAAIITPFVSEIVWTWKTVTDVTHQSYTPPPPLFDPHRPFFRADIVAYVTLGALMVVGGGCLFKMHQLAAGGSAVAQMLGAIPVPPNTADIKQRTLHDVVEEMAIASGIPPPALYLLSHEHGINAFVAGYTESDAVVCVTQGCIDKLTRDELQAVIAHEFSHILNGDMSLNMKLIGALYGILLIGLIGYGMIRGTGSRSRTWTTTTERSQLQVEVTTSDGDGNGFATLLLPLVAGIVLMVVGYVGLFFGRLVQAAVCRQREYLADAAAVQFTRNSSALGGALRKLGASSFGSRIDDHHAEQLAHMFFASSKGGRVGLVLDSPPSVGSHPGDRSIVGWMFPQDVRVHDVGKVQR